MTAAFNLSQLANNLNTSGQLDATDGLTGAVPVANGGTGSTTAAGARANLGTNDAANITTGTIATARLASGTANSTTFLRGDQTWATAGGTPTTAQVTSAYAGIAAGDVGSWIWGRRAAAYTTLTWGATYSANIQAGVYTAEGNIWDYAVSGTWRAFGAVSSDSNTKWTMWFRIA